LVAGGVEVFDEFVDVGVSVVFNVDGVGLENDGGLGVVFVVVVDDIGGAVVSIIIGIVLVRIGFIGRAFGKGCVLTMRSQSRMRLTR